MIGTELGHYRLTELLGLGGMGRVYAADDLRLERRVALKLLPDELREDKSQLERFQREARLLAAMSHPNVVTVYSVEEADGRAFITMELVEGHTLLNLVRPGGLPLDELLAIARPLAEALGAAHANGIVHRDLKPANVMLSRDGRLKVVDFGIAKPERSLSTGQVPAALTGAGLILGTLAYMAPEQLRGEAIDQRADWFAYAVLIFELATGRRPFAGDNDAELVSAILRDPPLSLVQLRSDLPAQLEGILDGCFQKDRVHRTNSAHDVIRALDELRNPGASGPRPAAPPKLASLAVLPLQELGGGVEDLLADGITEALITDLARTTGLKVISRSSVARFKSSAESLQAIARRLGVDALLVGSVRRGGDRIRISVELVEPASEQVLWADRYDRELGDVLRLQDEIAKAIADGIHIRVGRAAGTTQTPLRVDPEVYLLDLKGRSQIETRTDASFHAALAHFQQALVRDPNYGPCHLGVARAYNMMANYGLVEPVQTRAQVQSAIERARENHADRAEVLGEQAQMRWQFDFDWSGAEADFQRALELAPNSARLWNWRGLALATGGRFNTGLDCLIRAEELDPLSYVIAATRGMSLYFARRIPEAVACLRSVVELSPELAPPYWLLGMALVAAGDYVGAIATYEAAIVRMGRISRILGYLGHAYGRAGREEDARTLLAELDQRALGGYVPAYFSALILAGLDAREATLTQLERSWVERDSMLRDVLVDAPWDPLREDPRFRALIASMGPPSGAAGGEPGSTTRVLSP